jgi:hypothetical protein
LQEHLRVALITPGIDYGKDFQGLFVTFIIDEPSGRLGNEE